MYAKSISYVDYDGNERTETYLFNLNEAELLEMDMSENGGLEKVLRKMVEEQDSKRIFEMFKHIIRKSIGVKSPDGKRFVKSQEIADAFEQTEAYNELVMEMFRDPDKAAAFVNGIIPSKLANEVAKQGAAPTMLPMA